jgi:RNA polymerase subunit RPABC4/transcription elongation factor Spt4
MNIMDSVFATLNGVDTEWFTKVKHINHIINELKEMGVDIRWNASTDMELLIELNGHKRFYYPEEIDYALNSVRFMRDNAISDKSYLNALIGKDNSNNFNINEKSIIKNVENHRNFTDEEWEDFLKNNQTHFKINPKNFKICEECGKKINKKAEKCPYCNSTSFSNDISKYEDKLRLKIESIKYCPKCNEKFYESNFCLKCGEKLITPTEYENLIEKQKQKEIESLKNKKYCPICSEERNHEDIFCNYCGERLISGLDYDYIIKKRKKLENDPHYIQKLKELKDSSRQIKLKKQTGTKICPVCRQEISKNAAVCVYCRTKLKEY